MQEPTMTCSISSPSTSDTGTTRSGDPGMATSGSRLERSSSIRSSYSASASGASGRQSASRPRSAEVLARRLVRGEHAGGQRQLGAHVADGGPLGQGERRRAGPAVFEDAAAAAAHRVAAQQLHDHVLGRDPRAQPPGEPHRGHARHDHVIRPAAHGHRHVEAARADGQHAGRAAERGVAVGAQHELAGHAEGLEVHLVADAVARAWRTRRRSGSRRSADTGGRPSCASPPGRRCGRCRRPRATGAPAESPWPRTGGTPSSRWCR